MKAAFKNICVVGLGLIGGSIIKKINLLDSATQVYGLDINDKVTKEAHAQGLIKNSENNLKTLPDNSLVVLSVPSLSPESAFEIVKGSIQDKDVIFTDTFSSKSQLINFLEKNEGLKKDFIMSHPIAGSEKSGLSNSISSLFENKLVVLSSMDASTKINRVKVFWEELGSRVIVMDPLEHDEIFSKTSHLPHVIAFALMSYLKKEFGENVFNYSGGSLEGYTRIASSDPTMWKDIVISNKKEILLSLKGFKSSLREITDLIEVSDEDSLLDFLMRIKDSRDDLVEEDK
tara:strand:+ start:3229 stop:4092 length:864 start_codon:yes stop_codon:yes gene_type:complete